MLLRELKREVIALPNLEHSVRDFRENWLKPLRNNTNQAFPSLQELSAAEKKILNQKIGHFHNLLQQVSGGQVINEKLRHYAHHLIELKLTTLNGDEHKAKLIINQLLHDQFNNIKKTIGEVQHFEQKVNNLNRFYNHLNDWLQSRLPLEENLAYTEQPHKKQLQSWLQASKKQKELTKKLGQQLVKLARETSRKND